MMLTTSVFATSAIIAAIADRVVLQRNKLDEFSIKQPVHQNGLICFPMKYRNHLRHLKGAHVEYWLRNDDCPTTVITGRHRTLDLARMGENEEYLSFSETDVSPGIWSIHIRVTHGDCRWNPLYRLFPLQTTIRQQVIIRYGEQDAR